MKAFSHLSLIFEQVSVRARANENNQANLPRVIDFISKQKIATDVALAMPDPISLQGMIQPLGWQGPITGNQQHHRLFEPVEIVTA